ncbi:MAG: sulfatase-like hydrolase/transferase [Bacteroidota bacterium]
MLFNTSITRERPESIGYPGGVLLLFPFILLCCLIGCTSSEEYEKRHKAPNIIFLLADDLGYGDLSCFGSAGIATPNIDALAASGMRFNHFYAGSAVCSPSRASLLTGKFPLRFDIRRHLRDSVDHLPEEAITLPELLQASGYETCHIGKWHLGGLRLSDVERRNNGEPALPGPLQQGFHHYLTNIEGAPIRPALIKNRQLYREGGMTLLRNDERAPEVPDHWTELKVTEAIHWLSQVRAKDQPFFLNLWFDVPHTPYEPAPDPHLSKYRAMGVTGDQLLYRSMISHMDAQIGRLIGYLKENGLFEKTLVVFTSDNGPAYEGSPGPFSGGKADLHEGGIRVPMFAVWDGNIPAGTISLQPTHMVDLLPTIAQLVGFEASNGVDGVDMSPILLAERQRMDRPAMLWQMDLYDWAPYDGDKPTPFATGVVLDGQWKLLVDSLQPTELINLHQDHRELYSMLEQHPEKTDSLQQLIRSFYEDERYSWRDVGLPLY